MTDGGAAGFGGNGRGGAGGGGEVIGGSGGVGGQGGGPCSVGLDATLAEDPGIVSSGPTFLESESSVVATGNVVAVAFIAIDNASQNQIGYAFSTDGGATFGAATRIASPVAGQVGSDPVLAADSAGNIYLSWVAYAIDGGGNVSNMRVYVARADAGTTTFGTPVRVTDAVETDGSYDKPWVIVLPDDSVFVTFATDLDADPSIVGAASVDGGQTFALSTIVDASEYPFNNLAYPCVSPQTGRLYVVFVTDDRIAMKWSDTGGTSWLAPDTTNVSAAVESPVFEDPTCVATGDDVWVSYGLSSRPQTSGEGPLLDRVRIAHSEDGGVSIASRVDALSSCDGPLSFLPSLTLVDATTVDLAFYGGVAEGDEGATLRWSRSTDGGATWGPSRMLHQPVTLTPDRTSPLWMGDYVGTFWDGSTLLVSYADNSSGFSHTAFLKVTPD